MVLAVGLSLAISPLEAQRMRAGDQPPRDRAALEARFRERLKSVMQQRLGLNDAQIDRLADINARFEGRRRELYTAEREVRINLRNELAADSAANDERVSGLLDRALRLQRDRLDLFEAEQKELQQFMTPVQRAKYWGMQEQLRRQMEEMRERRMDSSSRQPGARGQRRPPPR
jgi:hypothetical protein